MEHVLLHIVYLAADGMLLTRKPYRDWREIQAEYEDYMTSLGPWPVADVIDFLDFEYPDLRPSAGKVADFVASAAETLAL